MRQDGHTILCKFCRFQIAVSQSKQAWLTPNLGILWISVCSLWLCGSIVANPIIYGLVPSPSRFEIRQCWEYWQYYHSCLWIEFHLAFQPCSSVCEIMHTSSFCGSITAKTPCSIWLKSDDEFCSVSPLKKNATCKLKAIAHKRNMISDQVLCLHKL